MKSLKKTAALLIALVIAFGAFAPTALAAYAPTNWANWSVQSRNNYSTTYTYALQNVLKGNYHLDDPNNFAVDGIFGNGTRQEVVRFQQDNNLPADGIVGSQTWGKMYGYLRLNAYTSYWDAQLDRYHDFYGVRKSLGNGEGSSTKWSSDWFYGYRFGGSSTTTWKTSRDGSRGTWRNIMD